MANTQHYSLTKLTMEDDAPNNRDSEFSFSNRELEAQQDRYSDYQHHSTRDTDRSSNAIVYENEEVRFSATSDRIVTRRRGIKSNNRVSSIYGGTLTSWAEAGSANSLLNFSIAEDIEDRLHDDGEGASVERAPSDETSSTNKGQKLGRSSIKGSVDFRFLIPGPS